MKSITIKYSIGDRVTIIPLEINGRVAAILQTQRGLKYEVRYFWDCDAKSVYFFEDELK